MTRIQWRHAYDSADVVELMTVALETLSAPTTPVEVPNRAERRKALKKLRGRR